MFCGRSHMWVLLSSGGKFIERLSPMKPVLTVMVSEMLVDWLKHAFITKFNHIRPSVYERYTDVLCRDLASGSAVGRWGARKVCNNPKSLNKSRFNCFRLAHIRGPITPSRAPVRLRFPPTSGPSSPRWLSVPWLDVRLRF